MGKRRRPGQAERLASRVNFEARLASQAKRQEALEKRLARLGGPLPAETRERLQ
jgi:hypothetical protein